jgi:hypothetical protein
MAGGNLAVTSEKVQEATFWTPWERKVSLPSARLIDSHFLSAAKRPTALGSASRFLVVSDGRHARNGDDQLVSSLEVAEIFRISRLYLLDRSVRAFYRHGPVRLVDLVDRNQDACALPRHGPGVPLFAVANPALDERAGMVSPGCFFWTETTS